MGGKRWRDAACAHVEVILAAQDRNEGPTPVAQLFLQEVGRGRMLQIKGSVRFFF